MHRSSYIDEGYERLKVLFASHKAAWTPVPRTKEVAAKALVQLDEQINELLDTYGRKKGIFVQAFKEMAGKPLCGSGYPLSEVVVLFKRPCYISTKKGNLSHYSTYSKRNDDGEEEEVEVKTDHVSAISLLQSHGFKLVSFYCMCYFPFFTKHAEPPELLITIFADYAKRRLDIIKPKVLITADSFSTKITLGQFTYRGYQRGEYIPVGGSQRIVLPTASTPPVHYTFLLCRIPNPYSLSQAKKEGKFDNLFASGIEKVLPKLEMELLATRQTSRSSTTTTQPRKIDAFSLLSRNVRLVVPGHRQNITAVQEDRKLGKRELHDSPTTVRIKTELLDKPSALSKGTKLVPIKSKRLKEGKKSGESLPRLFGRVFVDPISKYSSWIVEKGIGLLGPIDAIYAVDVMHRTNANCIINISNKDISHLIQRGYPSPPASCSVFQREWISPKLNVEYMEYVGRISFTHQKSLSMFDKSAFAFERFPLTLAFFQQVAKLYKFLESRIFECATDAGLLQPESLPTILIWSSPGRNANGQFLTDVGGTKLTCSGDEFAFFITALIVIIIRDIITKIREGAFGKCPFSIIDYDTAWKHFSDLSAESHAGATSVLVDKMHLFTKVAKADMCTASNISLVHSADSELDHVVRLLSSLSNVFSWWNGFTISQHSMLQNVARHMLFSSVLANKTKAEQGASKDNRRSVEEDIFLSLNEAKIESLEEEDTKRRRETLRFLLGKYLRPCEACPLCVCPTHGHNNFATNLCEEKSCRPPFREPSAFMSGKADLDLENSGDSGKDTVSAFHRALANLDVSLLTTRLEEEPHFGLQESFAEYFTNGKGAEITTCECILCNNNTKLEKRSMRKKGQCTIDWL